MKSSTILTYILASMVLALGGYAVAQVYPGNPAPTALVCAYNAGGPPTPTPGKFYYIQCDGSGKIIVQ